MSASTPNRTPSGAVPPGGAISGTVPEWVKEEVRATLRLRLPGIRVADVAYDSLLDDSAPGADAGQRSVVFTAGDRTIRLVSRPEGVDTTVIDLTLSPPRAVRLEVRQPDTARNGAAATLQTSDSGAAQWRGPSGLTTVVVGWDEGDGGTVRTAWLRL